MKHEKTLLTDYQLYVNTRTAHIQLSKRNRQINNTQTSYIKKRIEEISKQQEAAIRHKYIWVKPTISIDEKIKLIQAGKFELRANNTNASNLDWAIIFMEHEDPYIKERADAFAALNKERTRLMDNLVLGGVNEALDLLNNFAKKEF